METDPTIPRVTVLLPAYNAAPFLAEAIQSVLDQTFLSFEFIIINDGSSDTTEQIIRSFDDPRIRLVVNEKNRGLIATLNRGLDMARGEFIARMDSDDICQPDRLEKQVEYLDQHPEVGVLGSAYIRFTEKKKSRTLLPTGNERLKTILLFRNPIAHPTVVFRRGLMEDHIIRYDNNYIHAEDFQLWCQMSDFTQLDNLQEALLWYRVHPGQISTLRAEEKEKTIKVIHRNQMARIGIAASQEELDIHYLLASGLSKPDITFLISAEQWLKRLMATELCSSSTAREELANFFAKSCANSGLGWQAWKVWQNSELKNWFHPSRMERLRFLTKLALGHRQHAL